MPSQAKAFKASKSTTLALTISSKACTLLPDLLKFKLLLNVDILTSSSWLKTLTIFILYVVCCLLFLGVFEAE